MTPTRLRLAAFRGPDPETAHEPSSAFGGGRPEEAQPRDVLVKSLMVGDL